MEKSYKFVKYWDFWKFFSIKKLLDGYGFIRNSRGGYFFFRRSKLGSWEILVKKILGLEKFINVELENLETLTCLVEALANGVEIESFFFTERPAIKKIIVANVNEKFEKQKKMNELRKFYNI